jgi:hypothetical protein
MCLMLGTNRRTNIDFPLPVGPAIILVNGCIHGTGCDVTESDVTGSDVISSKVGDSPWGVILIVRCVV